MREENKDFETSKKKADKKYENTEKGRKRAKKYKKTEKGKKAAVRAVQEYRRRKKEEILKLSKHLEKNCKTSDKIEMDYSSSSDSEGSNFFKNEANLSRPILHGLRKNSIDIA